MLLGNLGAVAAAVCFGKGRALDRCLPGLLAHINLIRWIGSRDWFLNVKMKPWSTVAIVLLRPLEENVLLVIWHLIVKSFHSQQLKSDSRDMFNQNVRQEGINFRVHSKSNDGYCTAITWREGQGEIGGWDALGYWSPCLAACRHIWIVTSHLPTTHFPLPLVILGIYSRPARVYNLNYLSWEMGSLHDWETGLYL